MARLHEGDVVVWPGDMQLGGANRRTCVVISADVNNKLASTVVVLPLSSDLSQKGNLMRPFIAATRENGIRADSLALCEQPVTLPLTAIEGPYGRLSPYDLELLRGRLGWVLGIAC